MDVSRLFIYYNARLMGLDENEELADSGSAIAHAIASVADTGVCLEKFWPYDIKKVNTKPKKHCFGAAEGFKISEACQVPIDVNVMKSCLAQGFPIVVSVNLYKSFDDAKEKGIVPMPEENEISRSTHGR